MDTIPEAGRSQSFMINALQGNTKERVLGVNWDTAEDSFCFDIELLWKRPNKRGVLATMNSLFDPLGFLTPVIVEAKLIYRRLCELELEWDELLPQTELDQWERWIESLNLLKVVSIPRWIGLKSDIAAQNCKLHFFVDASKEAYGAVCYLRTINSNGNVNCCLLMSKSFLSPKDETSIPRLELLAAAVAVKLNVTLTNELNLHLSPFIFWTDLAIVLHSIANDRK